MKKSTLTKRSDGGATLSTVLGVAWIYGLSAGMAFYILYVSAFFTPVTNLILATVSLVLAPIVTVVPSDIRLRLKAGVLARKYDVSAGSVKDRSKIGLHSNGKIVTFSVDGVYVGEGRKGNYVKGRIQTLPMTDEIKHFNRDVQAHLEWSGFVLGSKKVFNVLIFFVHFVLLYTTSLHTSYPQLDTAQFIVLLSIWMAVSLSMRTTLLHLFAMKGQQVYFLQESNFDDTYFTMFDEDSYALTDTYLRQNDLYGTTKAVMLDGSLLLEVTRGDTVIEYALVQRK